MSEPTFKKLAESELNPEQLKVYRELMAGPRGGVRGPFNALLRSPVLADRVQKLGEFLRFETLTLCPIDTRCMDVSIMRADEIAWVNAYHATVRARLLPHVKGDAQAWLERRTQAL